MNNRKCIFPDWGVYYHKGNNPQAKHELHLIKSKFRMSCTSARSAQRSEEEQSHYREGGEWGRPLLRHQKSATFQQPFSSYHSGSASQAQTAGLRISGSPQVGSQRGSAGQWPCGCLKQISPEFYSQSCSSFAHTEFS